MRPDLLPRRCLRYFAPGRLRSKLRATQPLINRQFQKIKVWTTSVVSGTPQNIEPGKILMQTGSNPVIKCGEDAICLLITEPSVELAVGSYL
jgi:methionyl-tRNA formyltransferase